MNSRIKLVLWKGCKGTPVEGMMVLMSYDEKWYAEAKEWRTDRVGGVLIWFCDSWYDYDRFCDVELPDVVDDWKDWDNHFELHINEVQGWWEHASQQDIVCDHEWKETRV